MNAFIERDHMLGSVKVWLYTKHMDGTIYMWPTHRNEQGDMIWMQELVSDLAERPAHIKPALEMTGQIWEAFVKALRATDMEIPASKLLYKVLEREQDRVDALIAHLIKQGEPQLFLTSSPQEGM